MADLQRLLGGMMASGMGGRTRRGSAFAASPMGSSPASSFGGFKQTAGLGALAYLAYKAYQEYQKSSSGSAGAKTTQTGTVPTGTAQIGTASATPSRPSGRSLGDRLDSVLGMGNEPEPEVAALDDAHAMLLIRAMIAAANADGEIAPDERRRIESKLEQAGAGPEERAVLDRELRNPLSVDQLVREVHDQETAEQVYLASRLAMNPDTGAEKAYLDFLGSRLKIPTERMQQLNGFA
jgi:uncharacterized membrane protein YebE (DUF533 family)